MPGSRLSEDTPTTLNLPACTWEGALIRFLTSMSRGWNISLFHYRNHGADYGRVLVGMQVPPGDKKAFQQFLAKVGYPYCDETKNPAYRLFLG